MPWYCSREHQTGHWKQHKEVCKGTDGVSVRCREIARFLAEEPVDSRRLFLSSFVQDLQARQSASATRNQAILTGLVAMGVCETLLPHCSAPWQAGVVELVGMFCRLASVPEGAERLFVVSTFDLLAELFRAHVTDDVAMRAGCTLVIRFKITDQTDASVVNLGVVEGVVAAMRAHPAKLEVMALATSAVANLTMTNCSVIHRTLIDAGAVGVVEVAMLSFPGDRDIRNLGKKAVQNLKMQKRAFARCQAGI